MTIVFGIPYKPTPKIILLSLADNANDEGMCYPSLKTLADKSSVGKSNVVYVLNVFEKINILKREKRKRENGSDTSTLYILNIDKLNQLSNLKNVKEIQKEYEDEYHKQKSLKKPLSGHPKNHSVDTLKNHSVDTTPVHSSGHHPCPL